MITAVQICAAGIACLIVIPHALPHWWLASLASHFLLHLAIAAGLFCLVALYRNLPVAAIICVVSLGVSAYVLITTPTAPPLKNPGISLLSQNLAAWNRSRIPAVEMLRQESADIVVLQEYTPRWHEALTPVRETYPHSYVVPQHGAFGIAIYSRYAFSQASDFKTGYRHRPVIDVAIDTAAFKGRIIPVHFDTPMSREVFAAQNQELAEIAAYLVKVEEDYVIVGDFNNTPYAPNFRQLLSDTGLRLSEPLWLGTWPASLGVFGIPIDLVAGTTNVRMGKKSRVPAIRSDHRGIRIEISNSDD